MRLITSENSVVELGREIGTGGEGSVFDLPAMPANVAKVYHKALSAEEQAKLAHMEASVDQRLLAYTAWPLKTLHKVRGGPPVGFLMNKFAGRTPLHEVYSPARRRQEHPHVAWDYLLFAARNTAAAFETVHDHGHVVGDVNERNVLVGADSRVVLLDCDSFQVTAGTKRYLCEVGVGMFTAPELLGFPSFKGVVRTANHDNFGLALLIFHLLFGGRHPYAGIPSRSDAGESLEADIKNFRYAYARGGGRGKTPPPQSIPMTVVPRPIEDMFLRAFTEEGPQRGRPTAKEWVAALDHLRSRLRKCSMSAMHIYPDHLAACPWCQLETQGVIYFVDLGVKATAAGTGFVLANVWAAIVAVPKPPGVSIPVVANIIAIPKPMPQPPPQAPPEPPDTSHRQVWALIVVGLAAVAVLQFGQSPVLFLVAAAVVGVLWLSREAPAAVDEQASFRKAEQARRRAVMDQAKTEFDTLCSAARKNTAEPFHLAMAGLIEAKQAYEALVKTVESELAQLELTAKDRQQDEFLDRFFISSADIPQVGPAYKAALLSFGIETAADVDAGKVRRVRGFGDVRTAAMVKWRQDCLRQFRFDPKRVTVTEADRNKLRARYAARLAQLVTTLRNGEGVLRAAQSQAVAGAEAQSAVLMKAARAFAQAQADYHTSLA